MEQKAKVYKSKVDGWLVAVIYGVLAVVFVPMTVLDFQWIGAVIGVVTVAFVSLVMFGFRYRIADGMLTIKCCCFTAGKCDVQKMVSIRPTRTCLSAPAASLDRLEIRLGKRGTVIVSPRDKQAFIAHLQFLNPAIRVES